MKTKKQRIEEINAKIIQVIKDISFADYLGNYDSIEYLDEDLDILREQRAELILGNRKSNPFICFSWFCDDEGGMNYITLREFVKLYGFIPKGNGVFIALNGMSITIEMITTSERKAKKYIEF